MWKETRERLIRVALGKFSVDRLQLVVGVPSGKLLLDGNIIDHGAYDLF